MNPDMKKVPFSQYTIRSEHQLLVCCARVQIDDAQEIRSLVQMPMDWQYLLQRSYQQGVMPLLYRNLEKFCSDLVPSDVLKKLRQMFFDNSQYSLLLTHELIKTFKLFHAHGIAAVPYKGPVLAAAVYGDVSLREYGDIDIMVRQEDILIAERLLLAQGYRHKDAMTEHEKIVFLQSKHEHNFTFIHSISDIMLELHWRITPRFTSLIEPKHFWQNLEPQTLAGAPYLNLSLANWLPILCVHGSRHRWERLTWLCDIAEIMRSHPHLDWTAVIERSQVLVCRRMLFLGILLAHYILEAPLPEPILTRMTADAEVMKLVANSYQQLICEKDVADQFLGKTIYQIRASDRFQEKALYMQSFLQWLLSPEKRMMHH
jgi:Uncharacterised nucleotidyltransferase